MTKAELRFPRLLGTVTATKAQRVVRRIAAVLWVAVISAMGVGVEPLVHVAIPALYGSQSVTSALIGAGVGLAINLMVLLASGRLLTDHLLHLRVVGVDGRKHGGWAALHEMLILVGFVATAGLLPLIVLMLTMDADSRTWVDRLVGLTVIDVRQGRDVVDRPIRDSEVEDYLRPVVARGPAIINVGGDFQATGVPKSVRPLTGGLPTTRRDGIGYRLRFGDGRVEVIRGTTILGRSPEMTPRDPNVTLLAVPDGTLSKSHMLLVAGGAGIRVRDIGSTNGTSVVEPGGLQRKLPPGAEVLAPVGSRIQWGPHWFEIEGLVGG